MIGNKKTPKRNKILIKISLIVLTSAIIFLILLILAPSLVWLCGTDPAIIHDRALSFLPGLRLFVDRIHTGTGFLPSEKIDWQLSLLSLEILIALILFVQIYDFFKAIFFDEHYQTRPQVWGIFVSLPLLIFLNYLFSVNSSL